MPTTRQEFETAFPFVRETLVNHATKYGLPKNYLDWFEKVSSPRPTCSPS